MHGSALTLALMLGAAAAWSAAPTYTDEDKAECEAQSVGDGYQATWNTTTCPIGSGDPNATGGCCHGLTKNRQWTHSLTRAECYAKPPQRSQWYEDLRVKPETCKGNADQWGSCCYGPVGARQHVANVTEHECKDLGQGYTHTWTHKDSTSATDCNAIERGGCCYVEGGDTVWRHGYTQTECSAKSGTNWTPGASGSAPPGCNVTTNNDEKNCCYGAPAHRRFEALITREECFAKPAPQIWDNIRKDECDATPTGGCCHGTNQWVSGVTQAQCSSQHGSTDWTEGQAVQPARCGGTEKTGYCCYQEGGRFLSHANVTEPYCKNDISHSATWQDVPCWSKDTPEGGCCYTYPTRFETRFIAPIKSHQCTNDYGGTFTRGATNAREAACPVTPNTDLGGCCYGDTNGNNWAVNVSKANCDARGGTHHPGLSQRPSSCQVRIEGGCCYGKIIGGIRQSGTWVANTTRAECAAHAPALSDYYDHPVAKCP